jgi:hypothetical protein
MTDASTNMVNVTVCDEDMSCRENLFVKISTIEDNVTVLMLTFDLNAEVIRTEKWRLR